MLLGRDVTVFLQNSEEKGHSLVENTFKINFQGKYEDLIDGLEM